MAPKKKSNKSIDHHQPLDTDSSSHQSQINPDTSSSKNHKLNGVSYTGSQTVKATIHVNGCNGAHPSEASESLCSKIHTSSPEKTSKLEVTPSVEEIGASLNQMAIRSEPATNSSDVNSVENGTLGSSTGSLVEKVAYVQYQSELQMPDIMRLIQKDLSEPYSIYTYRYFIHNWPMLCFLVCKNPIVYHLLTILYIFYICHRLGNVW